MQPFLKVSVKQKSQPKIPVIAGSSNNAELAQRITHSAIKSYTTKMSYLKYYFSLIVLLVAYVQIYAQRFTAKPVIITANLIHPDSTTPRAMVFNFLNPFIKGRKSASFDSHNTIFSSEEIFLTHNMTIQYNDYFINLYVKPGDSVHLDIDAKRLEEKNFEWLTITGSNATISTSLNRWHSYSAHLPYKKYDHSVTESVMLDSVKADYKRYMSEMQQYDQRDKLPSIVKSWAENDIKYAISNWISDYLVQAEPGGKKIYRPSLFANSFFDQYNESNFVSMMFPYHLSSYTYTLVNSDEQVMSALKNKDVTGAAKKAMVRLSKEPAGLSRDYMLFTILSHYSTLKPGLLDSLTNAQTMFSDELTWQYLKRASFESANPTFSESAINGIVYFNKNKVEEKLPPAEFSKYIAKKHSGKLIYLDIYATWCGPCLKEMEYMPALKKSIDTAKVVFVNLCLQSEQVNWRKLIVSKKLTGENYYLTDDASRMMMGMYHLEGFPTYMLFDGKGQLITRNAPRPSDKDRLTSLLEEQMRNL